jgi:hypothetical protein
MSEEYRTNTLSVTEFCLHRDGESPMVSERSVRVRLDDEGGGPFIVLTDMFRNETVQLDFHELDKIYRFAAHCWRRYFQFADHSPEQEQTCDD